MPLSETETYSIEGFMVPLNRSVIVNEDGTTETSKKTEYFLFTLTLYLNTKHEDYKSYGGALESSIKDTVTEVVRTHTLEECQSDLDSINEEVLAEIQKMFDSNLIFKIGISDIKFGS